MFYVSLLEQNTTKKRQMNKFIKIPEFKPSDNKEYKVEAIQDSTIYAKKADGYLPGLYYLVAWKGYPKEKNT